MIVCFTKKLYMRREWAGTHDEAANHQLPIAADFWIIWIVSAKECSSLTQSWMQIHCSTHPVIFNVTATQYTCSLKGIYHPPRTSTVKSSLFTHVHSSLLSLAAGLHQCCTNCSFYVNNDWTFSGQTIYKVKNWQDWWRSTKKGVKEQVGQMTPRFPA